MNAALAKLQKIHQEHLLSHWNKLSEAEQQQLLGAIDHLDLATFQEQQKVLSRPHAIDAEKMEPFREYSHSGNKDDYLLGKQRISQGKAGCLIVAGGQGTRLKFDGPKGMFPVTPIMHKSLFELFAEKTRAASKQANHLLPLAIMTSPLNDALIRKFFAKNNHFGLFPSQIFFFTQKLLPFLDSSGNLFLDTPSSLSQGPDGNGRSLSTFYESGIWQIWRTLGVEQVNYLQIDNPLADPFDAEMVGFQARTGADATIKCILREDAEEKVGVLVKKEQGVAVVEYSEMPAKERNASSAAGLKYPLANISAFCFSMEFLKQAAQHALPLHASLKPAKTIEGQANAWKMEYFIFDNLAAAKKVNALLFPRRECFSPLKNFEGANSVKSVQEALQVADLAVAKKISGCAPPPVPFELAQEFYYPTPSLLSVWKDRPFPNISYITEGS